MVPLTLCDEKVATVFIKMLVVPASFGMTDEAQQQAVICAETGFSRAAEARHRAPRTWICISPEVIS